MKDLGVSPEKLKEEEASFIPQDIKEELENYSIAKSSNKSLFDQFKQISLKKLQINIRTTQVFLSELIIPFVIVVLFVGIG
jgi:hypothetical protein